MPSGAEAELAAAAKVSGIPIELWDVPGACGTALCRGTRDHACAPGTVGINLDPIRPAVFANSIAARLGIDMPRVNSSGTFATATIIHVAVCRGQAEITRRCCGGRRHGRGAHRENGDPEEDQRQTRTRAGGHRRGWSTELRGRPPAELVPGALR